MRIRRTSGIVVFLSTVGFLWALPARALYRVDGVELWPNGEVRVCWETGLAEGTNDGDWRAARLHPDFAILSAVIREVVENGWGRVANITFSGWQDCPSRRAAGNPGTVAIHWNTSPNSLVGYDSDRWTRMQLDPVLLLGDPNANPPRVANLPDFRGIVLHEFGHALGFSHEMDRPDWEVPTVGNPCIGNTDTDDHFERNYFRTPADQTSVMVFSYCSGTSFGPLSPWDVIGVRNAYEFDQQEQWSDPRVFDPAFYLARWPDLAAAFGNDFAAARSHWLDHGIREGRSASPAFDVRFYLRANPDVAAAFGDDYAAAIDHWQIFGQWEGRPCAPYFDPRFYLASYGDLRGAYGSTGYVAATDHWLVFGLDEGRGSTPAFDVGFYLTAWPDLLANFGAGNYRRAIVHWLQFGIDESRASSPVFDLRFYLATYQDLAANFGDDPIGAIVHWQLLGIPEGRNGSADFFPSYYLLYPDVSTATGSDRYLGAILHWLQFGRWEGRRGVP